MKATGIVRRIDDLGRVVIPKEIRRTMRIREGDPLEIYTDKEGGVIFKKYSLMSNLTEFAAQLSETLSRTSGKPCAITDRDGCIAVSGAPRRELLEKRVSPEVEPIGALLTVLFAGLFVPAMPYLLAFAAGAMIYVVVEELIPEMSVGEHSNIGVVMFALGFTVMMALDVALG